MTVIAVWDGCIQAAVGGAGKRPVLLFTQPYDRREEGALEQVLSALFAEKSIPKKNVVLLLSDVATRLLTLPAMPRRATAEAVAHEMEEGLVTDHFPLTGRGKQRQYLAAGCRETVIAEWEALFARSGVKLRRISTPLEGLLKCLARAKEVRGQSFLWAVSGGGFLTLMQVEEGQCRWWGRSQLLSPPGTEEFAREIETAVDQAFRECGCKIYYTGPAAPGLQAIPFPLSGLFAPLPEGADEYACLLGCFLGPAGKELDLRRRGRPEWKGRFYVPAASLFLAGLCVWGAVCFQNHRSSREISALEDWLAETEPRSLQAEQKWAYHEALLQRRQALEDLETALSTYPVLTSTLIGDIAAAGGEKVTMTLEGWDSASGTLSFRAESQEVLELPAYVQSLRETGLFRSVEYAGYQYHDGGYALSIRCVLKGGGL